MTARVIGLWTAQHTPRLLVDYPHPGVVTCNDVTGEDAPPDSPGVWEIAADAATTAAIEADSRYVVLWSEAGNG